MWICPKVGWPHYCWDPNSSAHWTHIGQCGCSQWPAAARSAPENTCCGQSVALRNMLLELVTDAQNYEVLNMTPSLILRSILADICFDLHNFILDPWSCFRTSEDTLAGPASTHRPELDSLPRLWTSAHKPYCRPLRPWGLAVWGFLHLVESFYKKTYFR